MARYETSAAHAPVALCGAVCFMPGRDAASAEAAGQGGGARAGQVALCCGIYCLIALTACAMAAWLP
jgi:hypothetical protein